ncbi:CBS domain-containing protein, partial [Vibrio cyclitrophicus]
MHSIKVKDYMTPQVVTFTPDMPLSLALDRVMRSHHMGGPVIDENEQVIGFLSEQDLLEKLVKVSYFCQDTHIVGDCMYQEVLSVSPDLSIIELVSGAITAFHDKCENERTKVSTPQTITANVERSTRGFAPFLVGY